MLSKKATSEMQQRLVFSRGLGRCYLNDFERGLYDGIAKAFESKQTFRYELNLKSEQTASREELFRGFLWHVCRRYYTSSVKRQREYMAGYVEAFSRILEIDVYLPKLDE